MLQIMILLRSFQFCTAAVMGAILICNNGAASFETIHTTTKELSIHTRSMLQGLASIVALGHAVAATVYGVSHQGCGIVFGESLLVYTPDHDSPLLPRSQWSPLNLRYEGGGIIPSIPIDVGSIRFGSTRL